MPGSSKPNIVLLMPDQHRADILGCAGDPVVSTPNIDQLAAEGVRFDNAFCQAPLCMPARASMLTERYVRDHGVSENRWAVPPDSPTVLRELQAAGYHTTCIGKMHLWVHGARFSGRRVGHTSEMAGHMRQLGFSEVLETVGKLASVRIESEYSDHLASRGLLQTYRDFVSRRNYSARNGGEKLPNWSAESIPLPADSYIDVWHGDRTARWIRDDDRDEPFFLWVGYPGPHDPWDAPADYVDRYRGVEMPMPASLTRPEIPGDGSRFSAFLSWFLWNHSDSETFTDERIQETRRHYYANVTAIDDTVGRIRDALQETGLLDNTWVIYTSDHGEMMGEHRMIMKMVFYDQSSRVPLIIRPPAGQEPLVDTSLAGHLDLMATIRAIAGAGAPAGAEGSSLLDRVGGRAGSPPAVVYSENYGFGMARTDRYKIVFDERDARPHQLFDLEEDPTEDTNLVEAEPALVEELMDAHVRPFLERGRTTLGPGVFDEGSRRRAATD